MQTLSHSRSAILGSALWRSGWSGFVGGSWRGHRGSSRSRRVGLASAPGAWLRLLLSRMTLIHSVLGHSKNESLGFVDLLPSSSLPLLIELCVFVVRRPLCGLRWDRSGRGAWRQRQLLRRLRGLRIGLKFSVFPNFLFKNSHSLVPDEVEERNFSAEPVVRGILVSGSFGRSHKLGI